MRHLLAATAAAANALVAVGSAMAQWRTSEPFSKIPWKTCRIETAAYTGSCKTTVFTLLDGSLNLHFDLDDTGLRGLTWGISAPPEGSDVFPVILMAERFGERTIRYSSGECRVKPQEIFCITHDGQQMAVVRQRLPN